MINMRFKMLVFQNGQLDEEVETADHSFQDELDLAKAMAGFAAMQTAVRVHSQVMPHHQPKGSTIIHPPPVRLGLGPDTILIISEVIQA